MDYNEDVSQEPLKILKHFPLLLPSNTFKYWEGLINVKGTEVLFRIECPVYPSIRGIQINCPVGFQSAMDIILEQVRGNHLNCLIDVLKSLEKINVLSPITLGDDIDSDYGRIRDMSWFQRCDKVLDEIKFIGAENVLRSDGSLSHLSLKKEDQNGHLHTIDIKLPEQYPSSKPVIEHVDLPDVVFSELKSCNSVKDIFSVFCSIICKLQNFWYVYDELRRSCWVIDPDHPKRKDTYCRIMVGNNVSIMVTLNPLEVMSYPEIQFLGADKVIAPFRKALQSNLKKWDMNNNLVDNLLLILGLEEFPQDPSSQSSQLTLNQHDILVADQECSICFLMRGQNNILPVKICNNDKCTSVVHTSCLAQWFLSIPTNEPSFNLISGDCPHCGQRILCPMKAM